ncbi:MAG: hypothetical protein E7576_02600 [Ruminococcaceae bacterium]|nr:hypothetical protein [Oscillospiraceae bacterium]MBR4895558.1 hypothetical protein [Clostridia bacterium]
MAFLLSEMRWKSAQNPQKNTPAGADVSEMNQPFSAFRDRDAPDFLFLHGKHLPAGNSFLLDDYTISGPPCQGIHAGENGFTDSFPFRFLFDRSACLDHHGFCQGELKRSVEKTKSSKQE